MKIAITGGAGFIGSYLARAYLDAGHDVLVIDSLVSGSREAVDRRARFHQMDIRDPKLRPIFQMERPDIVSHHAAERESTLPGRQPLTDADVNIRGLLNVLDSCVSASVSKIIFACGGNALYGHVDPEQLPLTEAAPLCPRRPHDISKVAGEWYVRYYTQQYGLAHTILRYADIFGEPAIERAQHPLTHFIHMLLQQQRPTIRGAAEEVRDHIYIDDVVQANLCALERGQNQTLHISSGQGYTLKQFYHAAAHLLQSQIEPVYVSNSLVEASSIVMDNTLAQRVLRWHPEIGFTEGVRRAVERLNVGAQFIAPKSAPRKREMAIMGAQ